MGTVPSNQSTNNEALDLLVCLDCLRVRSRRSCPSHPHRKSWSCEVPQWSRSTRINPCPSCQPSSSFRRQILCRTLRIRIAPCLLRLRVEINVLATKSIYHPYCYHHIPEKSTVKISENIP